MAVTVWVDRPRPLPPPNQSKNKTRVTRPMRENITIRDATKANNWLSNQISYDPFPNRAFRKMVWAQSLTLSTAAVAYQAGTEQILQLNNLFDPDLSGGTHQPYGMDQMAVIYGRYVVHAVTVDLRALRIPGQLNVLVCAIQPSNATFITTGNSVAACDEQPGTHTEFMDSQGSTSHVRKRFTIAEIEGTTESQLKANLEEYGALTTASPTRTPYLRLALANLASTTVQDCRMIMRLEFEAEFYDRNILPASN